MTKTIEYYYTPNKMGGVAKLQDIEAVFNGHTIAVWVGEGPVLMELSVEGAKKLRKLLKAAIEDTE